MSAFPKWARDTPRGVAGKTGSQKKIWTSVFGVAFHQTESLLQNVVQNKLTKAKLKALGGVWVCDLPLRFRNRKSEQGLEIMPNSRFVTEIKGNLLSVLGHTPFPRWDRSNGEKRRSRGLGK